MYEKPVLERFGSLRQLTAAPFAALGAPLSLATSSMTGMGGCGRNIRIGDPSACGRS